MTVTPGSFDFLLGDDFGLRVIIGTIFILVDKFIINNPDITITTHIMISLIEKPRMKRNFICI